MEEEYLVSSEELPFRSETYRVSVSVNGADCSASQVHVRVVLRPNADGGTDVGVACGVRDVLSGEIQNCSAVISGGAW